MSTLITLLFVLTSPAQAGSHYWLRNGQIPPGQPYGNNVAIGTNGQWTSTSGAQRSYTKSNVPSTPESTNRANGKAAYLDAYQAFKEGRALGKNRIEPLEHRGRWIKKIVTMREHTLYKDADGNVAVQSTDGKWHITTVEGEYAFTSLDLPQELSRNDTMIAGKVSKKGGRAPASLASPIYAEKPSADPVFDNPHLPK